MKTKKINKDKVNVITLGCSKNTVDSEVLIGQLEANDFEVKHDSDETANIVIVNTCGFIDLAKQESIDTILECAQSKSEGSIEKLYVTGCLSQRYREELSIDIPEVDAWFGTLELPALLARLNADYKHELLGERKLTTPGHYAYLKISEGCNRTCSFCAIPLMRGKHVSKPIEDLVSEAKNLAKYGVKELMLIAQELTYYGLDLYKKRALPELLKSLAEVDGIEWIKLHYAYPSKFPLEILDVINEEPKVCRYLDMPLQHASDSMLKAMKRQISLDETRELVHTIKQKVPGIAIRTTFLLGFPGETEEDVDKLIEFIKEMRFDRVGVFEYSHEEDTSAHSFEDDIPVEVKQERCSRVMAVQQEISLELNESRVGQTLKVIFDRLEGGYFIGRTEFDSPEVDNEVLVDASKHFISQGDFAMIKITAADAYDLYGEPVLNPKFA